MLEIVTYVISYLPLRSLLLSLTVQGISVGNRKDVSRLVCTFVSILYDFKFRPLGVFNFSFLQRERRKETLNGRAF